ncbi:alpha-L-arabinofuranosidase C-terminal domain-containing protein [Maribellus mangrovi]|uniref:alpha-L-arabinofuranosidase C-terminal domain-containing protein n=1 Tax=Maribellus mangrovi TaxID=3133146 RepID=UPI0030EB3577
MKKNLILLIVFFTGISAHSQVTIKNKLDKSTEMSQNLFGAFFEDINYGADGGLYAEMVQNRSFEYFAVPGYTSEGPLAHWSLAHSENRFSSYSVINDNPLNANNTNYLKLVISDTLNSSDNTVSYPFKGKIGVGSWATQVVFDDVKVVSGNRVWIDESFSDASNWDVRGGNFTVSNETYIQSSRSTPAWSVALTEIDTSVYTYTVKAMKTGGDEGFLFPFAYLDDDNYYWVNIGGWGNSQHAIEKCTSGTKSSVASKYGSISNDVWYTFKLEVTKTVCRFYMDDELLFEIDTPRDEDEVFPAEQGYAGVVNTGYFDMAVENGKNYKFSTYLKCEAGYAGIVKVSLRDANGTLLAADTIESITTDWQKFELELTPGVTSKQAYLSLLFDQPGIVHADMISLFPEETFKNRDNGLRKDLAQTIADLNPSFLRFPGGCVSHGSGLENAYRWKETVGDVAERNPNWNLWNYHQTYGLGFYEYFLYCEDIGAKPLPVLPVGISCQFRDREVEPIEKMGPWIQDAVDLVEFANGDVSTEWGSVRAEMGHPEPFNLEYICLGNEEDDIPEFRTRFKMFQDTLSKYCPEIKIIGTSGPGSGGSGYNSLWQFSREQEVFAVDEHYYNSPQWFLENNHRYDNFDRNGPKVFIGEYASQDDRLYNAISEAAYLTGVERNADVIEFTCYAPLLNYQEDIIYHWHPDMILFDNTSVAKTTNYYVQQMYGQNTGDEYFNSYVSYSPSFEGVASYDGKIGVGTWDTRAVFDDITVTSGDKVWLDEDFSSGSDDWSVIDGTFSSSNGTYVQSSSNRPALSIASTTIDTTVYTIQLKVMKTGGSEGFLIPFAYKSSGNYYWFNIGGWNNTQHAIEVARGGSKSQIMTKPGSINNNQWYTIKIKITESLSEFYIDDELIFELAPPDGPATASLVRDNETNEYILKVVNSSNTALDATINFDNTFPFTATADLTVLTGASGARNSMENPNVIAPVKSTITVSDNFVYQMPAYSFSLMRFSADDIALSASDILIDEDIKDKKKLIEVAPNPTADNINIRFRDGSKLHTVTVMNLNGQVQKTIENVSGDRLTIDRGNLPPGTYIISVLSENTKTAGKVILVQ